MQKVKSLLLFISLTVLLCLIGGGLFWGSRYLEVQNILSSKEQIDALIEASEKIDKIWREGTTQKLNCSSKRLGNYLEVNDNYLRCNSDYLDCWLGQNFLPREVSVEKNPTGRFINIIEKNNSALPHYGIEIQLKHSKGKKLKIILEDSCRDTYLPQRIYGYGVYSKNDWRWDNFNRHIFLDRFLVTNRDVNEWIDFSTLGKKQKIKKELDPKKIPLAATHLSLEQMKLFCASRGKELLNAHVFDGATFHPGNYEDTKPQRSFRGPYPWSRKKQDSYLYKAKMDKDLEFQKEFCLKTFTYECLRNDIYDPFEILATSWTGVLSSLGGPLEVFHNPIDPKNNLKMSSYYFDFHSIWHRLGKRGSWNGKGHERADIDWNNLLPEDREVKQFDIGFRCMTRRRR